jgi:hypothetical protein
MVEPTWWSSLIVAVLTVSAFLIWVSSGYRDWQVGHEHGLLDSLEEGSAFLIWVREHGLLDEFEKEEEEPITFYGTADPLWKCGLDNCYCINDSRYKDVWADD